MQSVVLVSSDNVMFVVDYDASLISSLVKETIEDDDSKEILVPLPTVDSESLKKITEFMTYYHKDPLVPIEKPIKSTNISDSVPEWYANYVNMENDKLFKLMRAVNYMDIKPLLDLTCAKVASNIKNKSKEEINEMFGLCTE